MVSCVDTCFAMEPARALRLKGYAVMFGSAVQYTSNIGMLYGFVTRDITTSGYRGLPRRILRMHGGDVRGRRKPYVSGLGKGAGQRREQATVPAPTELAQGRCDGGRAYRVHGALLLRCDRCRSGSEQAGRCRYDYSRVDCLRVVVRVIVAAAAAAAAGCRCARRSWSRRAQSTATPRAQHCNAGAGRA